MSFQNGIVVLSLTLFKKFLDDFVGFLVCRVFCEWFLLVSVSFLLRFCNLCELSCGLYRFHCPFC